MSKHITDRPRKRDNGEKLARYAELDKRASDQAGPQSEALMRESRKRDASEKLKRFTDLDRRKS
ncbi:MAG: hypothetical protein QNJ35_01480 [Paracoccaceae bacterium]|nr:hypothetical protein [Paracoccaceae bacterium]